MVTVEQFSDRSRFDVLHSDETRCRWHLEPAAPVHTVIRNSADKGNCSTTRERKEREREMKAYKINIAVVAAGLLLTGKVMAGGSIVYDWDNDGSQISGLA